MVTQWHKMTVSALCLSLLLSSWCCSEVEAWTCKDLLHIRLSHQMKLKSPPHSFIWSCTEPSITHSSNWTGLCWALCSKSSRPRFELLSMLSFSTSCLCFNPGTELSVAAFTVTHQIPRKPLWFSLTRLSGISWSMCPWINEFTVSNTWPGRFRSSSVASSRCRHEKAAAASLRLLAACGFLHAM